MKKKLNCVMLIDDNEDDNYFHKIILKETDVTEHIKVAESGFEALDLLTNEKKVPDLILLDINMPKMNGWEFLEEYRKLNIEQKARVVIVMLTTSLNPADRKKAEKISEINGFETKPLTPEILNEIIKHYFPGE